MSTDPRRRRRSTTPTTLSEEELRAAYEAELARIRVDDVLIQTVVSLLNLGARARRPDRRGRGRSPTSSRCAWRSRPRARCCRSSSRRSGPTPSRCATRSRSCSSRTRARARSRRPPPARRGAGEPRRRTPDAPPKPGDPDSAVSSGRLWVPGAVALRRGRPRRSALSAAAAVTLRARFSRPGAAGCCRAAAASLALQRLLEAVSLE